MKHTWIKESGSRWRCAACGVVKELSVEPRTEKYVMGKHVVKFYSSGIEIGFNPPCKP